MVATGAIARQPTFPKDKATGREFGESRRRMKQTKQNGAGISFTRQTGARGHGRRRADGRYNTRNKSRPDVKSICSMHRISFIAYPT